MQVQPYLFFDGRCDEALDFYKRAIGADVKMVIRFKDSPDKSMWAPENADKVMHAQFRVGDTTIMSSDGRNTGKPKFEGFALSIDAKNEADADKKFAALSEGGQVTMPLAKTFFSPRFGMVADKFGVHWMIHVAQHGRSGAAPGRTIMLSQTKTGDFVITRVFDAAPELLWKCFTESERMKEWFGPKGSVVVASKMDLRVGGTYHGAMRGPDGKIMWAKFVYREVTPPRRLVWEHSFSDEVGGLTRHPLSPTWPMRLLTTVTL